MSEINEEYGHTHVGTITVYWDKTRDTRIIPFLEALEHAIKHNVAGLTDAFAEAQLVPKEGIVILKLSPKGKQHVDEHEVFPKLVERLVRELAPVMVFDSWTAKII